MRKAEFSEFRIFARIETLFIPYFAFSYCVKFKLTQNTKQMMKLTKTHVFDSITLVFTQKQGFITYSKYSVFRTKLSRHKPKPDYIPTLILCSNWNTRAINSTDIFGLPSCSLIKKLYVQILLCQIANTEKQKSKILSKTDMKSCYI